MICEVYVVLKTKQLSLYCQYLLAEVVQIQVILIVTKRILNFSANLFDTKQDKRSKKYQRNIGPTQQAYKLER